MRDFAISTNHTPATSAHNVGRQLAVPDVGTAKRRPIVLSGTDQHALAGAAAWALAEGHPIVLRPQAADTSTSAASTLSAEPTTPSLVEQDWRVALYSSGSTGNERVYAFTARHLDQLAGWYADIYAATDASVIVTHLPITYNFAFIAGLCLASSLGARLHLATTPRAAFADADRLASRHDRCIIVGNPVLLAAAPQQRLADNVLIDSGGAPLSTTAIRHYREHVADVREGYGLTETGSLTHFDYEAGEESLGTVGSAMPHVETRIVDRNGQPRIAVRTPVLAIAPTGPTLPPPDEELVTSDIGRIDSAGRLRLLGRADDHPINGAWPRDVLDHIGPVLGTQSAQVRHPSVENARIRVHGRVAPARAVALRAAAAELLNLAVRAVSVESIDRLLHSYKIPRHAPGREDPHHA